MKACPNCDALHASKRPLCPTCMSTRYRTRSARRRTNNEHSYDDASWRKQRNALLSTRPPCVDCAAPAIDLDHVPPRRLLLAVASNHEGRGDCATNVDDPIWLHPRCKPCHSWRTMHIDLPLLRRLDAGEDAAQLCADALADIRRRPTSRRVMEGRQDPG